MNMSLKELEAEALKLDSKARACLASKLLESLENLSEEENMRLWVEEAQRRELEMDTNSGFSYSATEVFRDARAKLK
jgi:hypothetical protein